MEPPDPLHLDHIKASQGLKAVLALKQVVEFPAPKMLGNPKNYTFAPTRFPPRGLAVFIRETDNPHY